MSVYTAMKTLAEAIILQSIEDLWDEGHKDDSLSFFRGEGFNMCAKMAGIRPDDRLRLLRLIGGSAESLVNEM